MTDREFNNETENADWGQNCYDNFLERIEEGDYVGALDCMADMNDVFPQWAAKMKEELHTIPVSKFSHPTSYGTF